MLLKAINRTKGRPVKYIAFFTFCFYTQERKKAFILLSGYCMGQKQKHNRRKSTDKEQPDLYREEAVSCGQIEQIGGSLSLWHFPGGKVFLPVQQGKSEPGVFRKKLFNILFTAPAADFSTPVFSPVSVIYRNNRKISLHFTAIWRKIVTYNLWGCSSAGRAYGSHP